MYIRVSEQGESRDLSGGAEERPCGITRVEQLVDGPGAEMAERRQSTCHAGETPGASPRRRVDDRGVSKQGAVES